MEKHVSNGQNVSFQQPCQRHLNFRQKPLQPFYTVAPFQIPSMPTNPLHWIRAGAFSAPAARNARCCKAAPRKTKHTAGVSSKASGCQGGTRGLNGPLVGVMFVGWVGSRARSILLLLSFPDLSSSYYNTCKARRLDNAPNERISLKRFKSLGYAKRQSRLPQPAARCSIINKSSVCTGRI